MSRLDSFIRRLEAQRGCLDLATSLIGHEDGLVLEFGLGNGRTYDHLRKRLPERRIVVFERSVNAHASSMPPAADLVVGPLTETLPAFALAHAGQVVLAHIDIGCGDAAIDSATAAFLSGHLPTLLADRALVVSDQRLQAPGLDPLSLPAGIEPERYYLYRARPDLAGRSCAVLVWRSPLPLSVDSVSRAARAPR